MPLDAWTREQFLDLWRRLFPREYTRPIEDELDGQGLDAIAAFAAIFARVDAAVKYTTQRYYLKPHTLQTGSPAAGGAKATGSVELRRTAPVDQALDLVAGTKLVATYRDTFGATREGPLYVLAADVAFTAGVLGPLTATVEAYRIGFEYNVDAGSVELFAELGTSEVDSVVADGTTVVTNTGTRDRFSSAMIGRFLVFDTGPNAGVLFRIVGASNAAQTVELDRVAAAGTGDARVVEFAELGLTVEQPAAIAGGRDAWLDAIGADRRVFRALGEADAAYRSRICELADTISPAAITRIGNRILGPAGIRFAIKETRDPATWPALIYDVDAYDVGTPFDNGWVGGCDLTRSFVVCVSTGSEGEFGMPYDATTALQIPNAFDHVAAWDGFPRTYGAALRAFYAAVNAARAAGVCFHLALDLSL